MSGDTLRVAPDCALLPLPESVVVYKGATGRTYRISSGLAEQLVSESGRPLNRLPDDALQPLLEAGILEAAAGARRSVTLNRFAPGGRAGCILLGLLAVSGLLAWIWALAHRQAVLEGLASGLMSGIAWAWAFPIACCTLVAHEWGHVAVLRTLGGRAGRLLVRRRWPAVVVEVGPFDLLPIGQAAALISGGIFVEGVLLGWALAAVALFPETAVSAVVAAVLIMQMTLNLLPIPHTDGAELIRLFAGRRRGMCT